MKRARILFVSLILILSLILGSCGSNDTQPTAITSATTQTTVSSAATTATIPTTTATTVPPTTTPPTTATSAATQTTTPTTTSTSIDKSSLNIFTGLPIEDPSRAAVRPVAVMISNIQVATPQLGINSADLYYEMIVEGGITRILAVFADPAKVPELGSVRSARSDYIDFAGGVDAILVHAGGSYAAMDQIRRQKTAHINMDSVPAAFWRDPTWREQRGYEHSVRTTGKRLTQAIKDLKLRDTLQDSKKSAFGFLPEGTVEPASDKTKNPAATVTVEFSNYNTSVFRFDDQTGLYSKSQFGKPQIDLADKQPLKVTNVLVLRTTITSIDGTILRNADLSAGSGYYVSGGARVPIKWKKGSTNNAFVFTREGGSPLLINRGKTYICVQSVNQSLNFG